LKGQVEKSSKVVEKSFISFDERKWFNQSIIAAVVSKVHQKGNRSLVKKK
jgi:hypothetical protein